MKKFCLVFFLFFVFLTGCGSTEPTQQAEAGKSEQTEQAEPQSITLSTTTSTQDSGLLDVLLPVFEEKSGISVKVVAVGTGQAIQMGVDGNADIILVHAREAEDQFVADGHGVNAHDVMYNQFYIVGPESDPAGIKGMTSAADALKKISESKSTFISRGDDSGTHKKELGLWKAAGIEPNGEWYLQAGQGMGATLQMADEKDGYTLTDEATYLARKDQFASIPVVEGDPELFNPYGIIQVKTTEKPEQAEKLISFFTSPEAQELIAGFGKEQYGKGLFVPSAKKR